MDVSIEQKIKNQYAKFFSSGDWSIFKKSAEHYLQTAARLTRNDIKYEDESLKLLRRNVQKRLHIGLSGELLLKALYLKRGYCINKPKRNKAPTGQYPFTLSQINQDDFDVTDTFTFNQLLEGLYKIIDFRDDKSVVDRAFRIAKIFRNKEGHVAVLWHDYEPQDYRDVEAGLIAFYKTAFSEILSIKFSVGNGEKAIFSVESSC